MNFKNLFDLHKIIKLPSISLLLSLRRLEGFWLLLLLTQLSFAQKKDPKKDENIETEVVNVVKPYTPTISDAFKVSETPMLDDADNSKKEVIKYSIFSFPVVSTFTPSKGKAEGVEEEKQAYLYNNYATFGVGNFGKIIGELFVNQKLNSNDYVGGMFRHLSSQGGIKGVELNDSFYDTSVDLTYGIRKKDLSWNVDLGYQNQIYNWYGLPAEFENTLTLNDRSNLINSIDPNHSYNNIYLGSKIAIEGSFFKDASAKFSHFSDNYGSVENRFYAKPTFEFNTNNRVIKTNIILDHLEGEFKNNYQKSNIEPVKYGFTNFGIAPSFALYEDDWTIKIGADLFYSSGTQNSSNKLYLYPQINASLKVVGDLMNFYIGAEGNLQQNTYWDFVSTNPFLSPTLLVKPTNQLYDLSAGLKGKLATTVSYNLKASYINERDKALFRSNDYTENTNSENYAFGNSFQVLYDDVKTISFYGELKADISENLTFGIDGTFRSFTTYMQKEAWNLPAININMKVDVIIFEKWFAGANLFFVGERKDQQFYLTSSSMPNPNSTTTLDSYFDINAHLGYQYNSQLSAFLRANNIANQAYQKWLNYPVQGFQVVLGANYKFDF